MHGADGANLWPEIRHQPLLVNREALIELWGGFVLSDFAICSLYQSTGD
jgi:hypothetical protein